MATEVTIPDGIELRVRRLVEAGEYPSFQAAVEELLREGLDAHEGGGGSGPWRPPGPDDLPPGERPTTVDPSDVNWMA